MNKIGLEYIWFGSGERGRESKRERKRKSMRVSVRDKVYIVVADIGSFLGGEGTEEEGE